jgi:hypothetical protein
MGETMNFAIPVESAHQTTLRHRISREQNRIVWLLYLWTIEAQAHLLRILNSMVVIHFVSLKKLFEHSLASKK